jgi:hypothetical protein
MVQLNLWVYVDLWIIDEVELTESEYSNGQQEETNEDAVNSNAQGQTKNTE